MGELSGKNHAGKRQNWNGNWVAEERSSNAKYLSNKSSQAEPSSRPRRRPRSRNRKRANRERFVAAAAALC
jgi:hypothetical protein